MGLSDFWLYQWGKSLGPNFGTVLPDALYRGAHPGERLIRYKRDLHLAGILDLRLEDRVSEERKLAERLGIDFYNVPMDDHGTPDPVQVQSALAILSRAALQYPMMAYCQGGRHRTGLIVACYRVVMCGWSKEQAWKEAVKFSFYEHGGRKPMRVWFEKEFKEG